MLDWLVKIKVLEIHLRNGREFFFFLNRLKLNSRFEGCLGFHFIYYCRNSEYIRWVALLFCITFGGKVFSMLVDVSLIDSLRK